MKTKKSIGNVVTATLMVPALLAALLAWPVSAGAAEPAASLILPAPSSQSEEGCTWVNNGINVNVYQDASCENYDYSHRECNMGTGAGAGAGAGGPGENAADAGAGASANCDQSQGSGFLPDRLVYALR